MSAAIHQFRSPTLVQFGRGAVEHAGAAALRYARDRVLVISDPGVRSAGILDRVTGLLSASGLRWDLFVDVEANPSVETVRRALTAYQSFIAEAIVVVGGGSALDVAKAVAILATNGGSITDFEGADRVPKPAAPVIGIPTTAGTASEITPFCVITDRVRKFKFSIFSLNCTMREAIMDPELTLTMPPALTAAVGMDALTHAIESYTSKLAYPFSEVLSLAAIELVQQHLATAVHSGNNSDAREGMLMACWMAGVAFSQARLGNVHAMSHPAGGRYNVPHGVANAIILPTVMEWNAPAAPEKFARVAHMLGHELTGNAQHDALASVTLVRQLSTRVGIPEKLSLVGVPASGIPALATDAMKSGNVGINPRPTTYEDMIGLFERCL